MQIMILGIEHIFNRFYCSVFNRSKKRQLGSKVALFSSETGVKQEWWCTEYDPIVFLCQKCVDTFVRWPFKLSLNDSKFYRFTNEMSDSDMNVSHVWASFGLKGHKGTSWEWNGTGGGGVEAEGGGWKSGSSTFLPTPSPPFLFTFQSPHPWWDSLFTN